MAVRKLGEKKVDGVEYCTRCEGYGRFHVASNNGSLVPAKPDAGVCYKCGGTGLESIDKSQNKTNQKESATMIITQAMQRTVFEAMVVLVEAKGARNKMVGSRDIRDYLNQNGHQFSLIEVESALDKMIQSRYVRYYRNEKRYIYFGITQSAWEKWEALVTQELQTSQEVAPTSDGKVICPKCGKRYTKRGIANHMRACG